jgi:hypothetical protein
MILLSDVLEHDLSVSLPVRARMVMISPPALRLLPGRRMRPGALLASLLLHAISAAAFLFVPRLFPTPVFVHPQDFSTRDATAMDQPLLLPQLPPLANSGAARSRESAGSTHTATGAIRAVLAPPRVPDYTAPQTIISELPNAVNRIQTIQRPDLAAPPNLKFPLRLQSVVLLPSTAAPVLAKESINPPVPVITHSPLDEHVPLVKQTTETPVLKLNPRQRSVIRSNRATAQPSVPNLAQGSGTQTDVLRALVVINAVQVVADPSAAIPEGQLSGRFVVGPSGEPGAEKEPRSTDAGTGHNSDGGGKMASKDGLSTGAGSGNPGHRGIASGIGPGTSPEPGTEARAGSPNGRIGSGTSGNSAPGISISGGAPGRGGATARTAVPQHGTYSLMIISGGSSGGASRDVGVFGRNETVYSVSIPMGDAGGGPDWTMQYALLTPEQNGKGLLVPPLARKKSAATMSSSALSMQTEPVLITAIIDEQGKLQAMKSVRAQDGRSQAALRALQQWEFLPAQLDGRAVATKVLLGIPVKETQ